MVGELPGGGVGAGGGAGGRGARARAPRTCLSAAGACRGRRRRRRAAAAAHNSYTCTGWNNQDLTLESGSLITEQILQFVERTANLQQFRGTVRNIIA